MNVTGQGFNRLLILASVIIDSAGGIVLIDEIENGLHYSVLADVWRIVVRTAKDYKVQIFATTHSRDCYEALAAVNAEGMR